MGFTDEELKSLAKHMLDDIEEREKEQRKKEAERQRKQEEKERKQRTESQPLRNTYSNGNSNFFQPTRPTPLSEKIIVGGGVFCLIGCLLILPSIITTAIILNETELCYTHEQRQSGHIPSSATPCMVGVAIGLPLLPWLIGLICCFLGLCIGIVESKEKEQQNKFSLTTNNYKSL